MKKVEILGVKIDNITFNQALIKIERLINGGQANQVVTINPEFIMEAQKDKEFKRVLNFSSLAVADGTGLIWASKFLYGHKKKLSERIAGVDLVWELAKQAERKKWSIYLLGSEHGVAKKASECLCMIHRNLKIAGVSEGEPKISTQEVVRNIKKSNADILLVAYGTPKQEKFIFQNLDHLKIKVAIGVGGTFDFIAGMQKRAPKWMQDTGLEWLWRLIREPKRFNRILTATIRFPWKVFWTSRTT